MKHLLLAALTLLFISLFASAQRQKPTGKKTNDAVLPTKQQWEGASISKGMNAKKVSDPASPLNTKDANRLPTEAQWEKAAMSARRSNF